MTQIDPGIILTGSQEEASALSRQFPGLTFRFRLQDDEKPVKGKDYILLVTPQSPDTWRLNAEASWGQNLYLLGAKTVRHYWPSNLPAIVSAWRESGLTSREFTRQLLAAPVIEFKRPRPIQAIRSHEGSGLKYLAFEPEPPDWVMRDSMPRGCLAGEIAPPGTGKGYLALQLGVHLAAGKRFFNIWEIERPRHVLYVSGEESPRVIHERARAALLGLPPELREEAAGRFWAFSLAGCVHLVEPDGKGGIQPTESLNDLERLIDELEADVVFIDTLGRFTPCDENNNQAMTMICGLLEELIARHECNIVLLHHTNKLGGAFANSKEEMRQSLSQTAIRGASALPACIRWGLMMVPLGDEFAQKVIGEEAIGKPPGTYVAARVAKKNEGKSEPVFFLEHGEGGLFTQVEAVGQDSALADAELLAEEVRRRAVAIPVEPYLAEKTGGQDAFGWGWTRSKRAAEKAIEAGLLITEKRPGSRGRGGGYILISPISPDFPHEAGGK